jgi:hypothetical protein
MFPLGRRSSDRPWFCGERGLAKHLPHEESVTVSVLIGRLLAVTCHPVLAWPLLRPSGRVALAAGYAGLSYLAALLALLARQY